MLHALHMYIKKYFANVFICIYWANVKILIISLVIPKNNNKKIPKKLSWFTLELLVIPIINDHVKSMSPK